MSLFKRFELLEPYSSPLFYRETCICKPRSPILFPFSSFADEEIEEQLGLSLDILSPGYTDFFECAADLLQIERPVISFSSFRRFQERLETESQLRSLSDRVTALELGSDPVLNLTRSLRDRVTALELGSDPVLNPKNGCWDRRYTWTAEIKGPKDKDGVDRKYKWVAESKSGGEKNYKWKAEINGKGRTAPISHTYTFQASTAPAAAAGGKNRELEKAKKDDANKGSTARVVEISESDRGALVLKQAFAKRSIDQSKGKRKELSPQVAAIIIQSSYRAYLVRRSQVLHELRDLAVAKAKLKEIRVLFSNYSYRCRIESDAEERQRFSEKIIVLLLTVDAIKGFDYMVRAARRSIVTELDAMLEVVGPQSQGKLGSMKRRKFDLPETGIIPKEMALGVAEVVQMLDQEEKH